MEDQETQNAFLLESSGRFGKSVLYVCYEFVQKTAEDLDLGELFEQSSLFHMNALTVGLNYDVVIQKGLSIAPGAQITVNVPDSKIKCIYGDLPLGFQVYLRSYPTKL